MTTRNLDVVQVLIRNVQDGDVGLLTFEHDKWKNEQGRSYLTFPCKKSQSDARSTSDHRATLDDLITTIAGEELGLMAEDYWIEQELQPTAVTFDSPTHNVSTNYTLYPVSLGTTPHATEVVRNRFSPQWLTPKQILESETSSPTARSLVEHLQRRERDLDSMYDANPDDEHKSGAAKRLFRSISVAPDADALTRAWAVRNNGDVRVLCSHELAEMMDAAGRAINLLVADPYLWYQRQGHGVTWAFFSHRDRQDLHIHPLGVTEFYGVLEGQLEIWWRPYHASGASAWSHSVLRAGDWAEVGPLQWHIVHWLCDGNGVDFKAGTGPLAGVGRLGTAGKTNWDDSHGVLPPEVRRLVEQLQ